MKLVKCPRCELNYMPEGEKYCDVCKRDLKGGGGWEETPELCIECGQRPAMPGEDLCRICLREALGKASAVAAVVSEPQDDVEPDEEDEDGFIPVEDEQEEIDEDEVDVVDEPMEVPMPMDGEDELEDEDEEDLPLDERAQ
nr:hypothetical protein [bacterium]